jgi:CRISPR-associated exonuclease Cas4
MTTLYIAAGLFFLSLFLFWQARRKQAQIGLPSGRVIYVDDGNWNPVEQPLYDPELGLVGKPDYLVEDGENIIPVEVKSSQIQSEPYDSHIFQLAAYCVLVERVMGKKPRYGILHYLNRDYAVDFTSQLEQSLIQLIKEIHSKERRKGISRSHESSARCNRCGYRGVCEQRLL